MPPKKKEKLTCDVGTDPPDPFNFDPLDLDGLTLWNDFKAIAAETREALDKLKQQNTTGAPKVIKDNVIKKLESALRMMLWYTATLDKTRTLSNRLQSIHRDLHEIKAATKEIPPTKTAWAQIAATNTATAKPVTSEAEATARANRRAAQEKIRKEREPYEVTLTTTHGETKEKLVNLHPVEITKRCQDAIDNTESETEVTERPKLNGINGITNGIRLQCKCPEQAKALRTMDWNTAFEGLKVHKPQYGIVVHGVSTADLAHMFENEDVMTATIKEWEAANSGLTIAKITRLRRKPRVTANGEPLKTQSVVVHTEDPHAADKCIRFGFFIDSLHYKTARYAPQCFLIQCYKCFQYGHRATHCKHKEKCGNCGAGNHRTKECKSTEHTCCRCKGKHQAWSLECPDRVAEQARLGQLRKDMSPFFTS